MNLHLLCNQAVEYHQRGNLVEAEQLYLRVLENEPDTFTARHLLGVIRAQQGRHDEALELIGGALRLNPGDAAALANHGNLLKTLGRHDEALAAYDRTLAIKPHYADVWKNRGLVLQSLKRPADALESFDRALALKPDYAEAWNHRGLALRALKRLEDALESHGKALAAKPDYASAWNNQGAALQALGRFDAALDSFGRALALKPDYAEALNNQARVLCECDRVEESFALFARYARQVYGEGLGEENPHDPAHKLRHDREQRDYLADTPAAVAALPAVTINPALKTDEISEGWHTGKPQIVVIDNLLTEEALRELRQFCLREPVWRIVYGDGYLAATPETGFATPLMARIAGELRQSLPAIFAAHPLRFLWGFKYDSRLSGTKIHADKAAVNVNFWITPDESNLDPDHGGLVVWDVAAPQDWDFSDYNGNEDAIRAYLERSGAKAITIPYRANRAVIFDSDLFHETDGIAFKDGYCDRRINVTLLYGRRTADDS